MVQEHRPQVLVLDLFMPESDGFELLRTLDRTGNRVASVVLTGSESHNDYVQVVRLGARGLVLKGDDPRKLFAAIRTVSEGELAFSDEIARSVLESMVTDQPPVAGVDGPTFGTRAANFLSGCPRHEKPRHRNGPEY